MCLICFLKCPMQFQMINIVCTLISPLHSKFSNWNKFIQFCQKIVQYFQNVSMQVHKIKTALAYIINYKGNSHEKMPKEFFRLHLLFI